MTTRWFETCVAVIGTLATHRVTYRFLLYSLSVLELFKAVHWSRPSEMSFVYYSVAVLGDGAVYA